MHNTMVLWISGNIEFLAGNWRFEKSIEQTSVVIILTVFYVEVTCP